MLFSLSLLLLDWDEKKLASVVQEKHAGQKCQSTIICKFFLEAVRERKYGWFWECPNGETCHYRHALPPGFVLEPKKKIAADEDEEEEVPLEDILDAERAKLQGQGTPITLERLQEWKAARSKKLAESDAAQAALRERDIAAGKAVNLTGRELLQYRPELFNQEEDPAEEEFDYAKLRAELLAEEDAEAGLSVANYQERTKTYDMDIDESLFLAGAAEDDGANDNNNNNNNNEDDEEKGDKDEGDDGESNSNANSNTN